MIRTISTALALLALGASGALAQDIPGLLIGRVTLAPLATEITGETRTATFGDVVLSQQARVTEVAQLQREVPIFIGTPTGDIYARLREGETLYRVELNEPEPQQAFCSFDPTIVQRPSPRPADALRFCLGDIDSDGDFDSLYVMSDILGGRRESGVWVQNLPPLVSGGDMRDAGAIETPARYTVLANYAAEPVQIDVVLSPAMFGIAFHLVSTRDGDITQLDSRAFPHEGAFPATIDVAGARIEVLSREGETITYRVLNGFPEQQIIRVATVPIPFAAPRRTN